VPRDVKVVAHRDGWIFAPVEARVYPYEASPAKVTVALVEGQPAGGGGPVGDDDQLCFISAATSGGPSDPQKGIFRDFSDQYLLVLILAMIAIVWVGFIKMRKKTA